VVEAEGIPRRDDALGVGALAGGQERMGIYVGAEAPTPRKAKAAAKTKRDSSLRSE
jgi:hypothetical protein